MDVDLSGSGYGPHLLKAVQQGLVEPAVLDTAVARVLRMKFNLGLFDRPYVDEKQVIQKVATAQNKSVARAVARESIILLKMKKYLTIKQIVETHCGYRTECRQCLQSTGDYTAPQADGKIQTVLTGIRAAVGKGTQVDYVKVALSVTRQILILRLRWQQHSKPMLWF
ncbi:hypothetical protein KUH03_13420 [Sphingobacterium sp. E70]|uniref:hypothetical protein n=1 Tax=Sphingobacterium sp. E70 TaxID=2853439 RepID=UPI00211C91CE|nr:hypothetical protein [Sphingobacterium sp. E70]ULT27611.1 hypothetical protein KUH03_13420 [Sphingobacterium sp. E70]